MINVHRTQHPVRGEYRVDPSRIPSLYHGSDVERFRFTLRPDRVVPTAIAVGRLVEQKGLDRLLYACATLSAEGIELGWTSFSGIPELVIHEKTRSKIWPKRRALYGVSLRTRSSAHGPLPRPDAGAR